MTPLISHSLVMLAGVLLAWLGGELLVRGTVGVARWAGWPASIVAATVAAFGTSSPELMVGIQSALAGTPQISLGDVLGSNIANVPSFWRCPCSCTASFLSAARCGVISPPPSPCRC